MRQQKYLFALLMLLAVFAACKGESPTAPPSTSTSTNGGGTPVTGSTITLTATPATALVSTPSVVTATVTLNNQPVPNGTAVEFTTDFGSFSETGAKSALRTTTGGVATVTLTSSTAGKATIQAVVNNVSKTTSVTFNIQTKQCPPDCSIVVPTVTGILPAFGSPAGGDTIVISGANLKGPVRVFFDFGTGTTPKEAFVVSATESQIVVTSPPVDLGTGQTKNATIIVVTQAGTADEQRTPAPAPFVYQAEVLTPSISTVSPDSGPIDGGTRITIFGSGFQAPVQVSFSPGTSAGAQGWTAIQVVSVRFDQIVAITPAARDVNPTGSGPLTGPVDLRVRNINSNTEIVKSVAFQYKQKIQITAFGPGFGSAFGGTHVTIDGIGFNDPIAISIGGVVASPIKVTNTQVIAVTGRTATPCNPPSGPVVITNVDNGDQGSSTASFAYTAEIPLITGFTLSSCGNSPGCSVNFTVTKPGVGLDGTGLIRFTFGTGATASTIFPTPSTITDPVGPTTFTMTIPDITFATQACTVSGLPGTQQIPTKVDVTFKNVTTGCSDTLTGFVVSPPSSTCTLTSPAPAATVNPSTFCPNGFGTHPTGSTTPLVLTVSNTGASGASPLIVSNALLQGTNADQFTVTPTTLSVPQGTSQPMTISFKPTSSGVKDATLTLFTNDPARQTINICLQGTAP